MLKDLIFKSSVKDLKIRIMLYGGAGLGKTTFAAQSDNPVFIITEDGLGLNSVDSFPLVKSCEDVLNYLRVLYEEDHEYKTLVIDSLDWLENIIASEIQEKYSVADRAYGKDTLLIKDQWGVILKALNHLRAKKNMSIILIAHEQIKRYQSPLYEEHYDRHIPKLLDKTSALIQEWCDCVLFAAPNVIISKKEEKGKVVNTRDIHIGRSIMYTCNQTGFLAKNRFNLPEQIDLDFKTFKQHIEKKILNNQN